MKTVEKTVLVIALVLISCCAVSFAVLFFTDFWVAPLKSTAEVTAAGRGLIALDPRFPFGAPEGTGIPKERLEPFLDASCRTKASADAVQAWIEKNGQVLVAGQPVYSEEGAKLMVAYVKDLTAALPQVEMGPREFDWIHQRLRLVEKGPPSSREREKMKETLDSLHKVSEDPLMDAQHRAKLKRHIAELETMPEAWGPPSQADWALYQANAERIKACGHGNRAVRAVGRFLVTAAGKDRTYVEVNPEDASPQRSPGED